VHLLGIALPVALGAARLARRRDDRFAWLLVGAGLLWSLVTLAESSNGTLYSIGRVDVWLIEPILVYLMLAFPSGRLATRLDRGLATAAAAVAAILYLPTVLIVQDYPTPVPWASCGTHCPGNALSVVHTTPAFVGDFVRPLRETLIVLLFAGVAVALTRRARRSGRMMRGALAPVALVAFVRTAVICTYFV